MNKLVRNLLAVLTLLGGAGIVDDAWARGDTGEDTVMAEGMDSTEAMALMGIMDTATDIMDAAEGTDSTSTTDSIDGIVSTMVSTGIMDSAAVSVLGPHLSSRLIVDTTHTTRHLADTPSLSTGTTAPTPRVTTHTSPTAGSLGCQSSRTAPLHSQQRVG